jgi:hypothetical protein
MRGWIADVVDYQTRAAHPAREVATGFATIISSDAGTRDWCATLLVVKVVLFPGNGQE